MPSEFFFWVGNHLEPNVKSLCSSEVTRKIKQLEVEGARAPVPHSWRRKWLQWLMSHYVLVTRRSTIGDRAFPVAAAHAWNSLPSFVTSSSSLSTFKRHLKTYLFATSYWWRCWPSCLFLCLPNMSSFQFLPRDASAERGDEIACRLSVTFRYHDHIGWNSSKIIPRPNSLRPLLWLTPTWAIWCNRNTPKIRAE